MGDKPNIEDMIKALKCVASQTQDGDCHADIENFKHLDDADFKRVVCTGSEKPRDPINGGEGQCCPYYQKTYGCCFEDGELYWLDDVAKLLKTKWIDDGEKRQAIPDPEIRSNGHSKCCNKLAEMETT